MDSTYKILNIKLTSLEDKGLLVFRSELLSDDFQLLSEIFSQLPPQLLSDDFVRQIGEFYRCFGKEEELLLWAIQREISDTELSPDLFRMQSFATQLLFKNFFDERGITYLKNTVAHVLVTVMQMKEEKLELSPNGITVSVDEAYENLLSVLDIIKQLFSMLDAKMSLMPRAIRKGFICMKRMVKEKFPEVEDSVVPICFFLRCLCPTLMQPEHFGFSKERPTVHAQKALVMISKLLQNIANGIVKNNITNYGPHDKYVLSFIKESIVTVKKLCDKLTDVDQLNKCKYPLVTTPEKEKEEAFKNMCELILRGSFRNHLDELESVHQLKEKFTRESRAALEDFMKNVSDDTPGEWKKFKGAYGLTAFMCKAYPLYKMEGSLPSSLESVRQALSDMSAQDWFEILRDKCIIVEKSYVVSKTSGGEKWFVKIKFPFPYNSRNATLDKIFVDLDKGEFAVVFKSLPPAGTQLDACFCFKEVDGQTCHFSVFYRLLLDTNFPQGIILGIGKDVFRSVLRLRNRLLGLTQSSYGQVKSGTGLSSSSSSSHSYSHSSSSGTFRRRGGSFRKLTRRTSEFFSYESTSSDEVSHSSVSSTSRSYLSPGSSTLSLIQPPPETPDSPVSPTESISRKSFSHQKSSEVQSPAVSGDLRSSSEGEPVVERSTPVKKRNSAVRTRSNGNMKNSGVNSDLFPRRISVSRFGNVPGRVISSPPPVVIKNSSTPKFTPTKIQRRSGRSISRDASPKSISPKAISPKAVSPKAVSLKPGVASPKLTSPKQIGTSLDDSEEDVSLISDEDLKQKVSPKSEIKEKLEKNNILSSDDDDPDLLSVSD